MNELEALAKAAKRENGYAYCNPETILRLIELVREMWEALEEAYQYDSHYFDGTGIPDILAFYKEMK